MTTFDDDFVRLNMRYIGTPTVPCVQLGLEWPPPERLYIDKEADIRAATDEDDDLYVMRRASFSRITDEQRSQDDPSLSRRRVFLRT